MDASAAMLGVGLFFGSGGSLADGIAMALLAIGVASVLGLALLIAHVAIIVKLTKGEASQKLLRWNRGLAYVEFVLTAGCLVVFAMDPGGADTWKILPIGALLAAPGAIGLWLAQKQQTPEGA